MYLRQWFMLFYLSIKELIDKLQFLKYPNSLLKKILILYKITEK